MRSSDPRGVYWGDPRMWGLTPYQREALRRAQITPLEARDLLRPLLPFRLAVQVAQQPLGALGSAFGPFGTAGLIQG